MLKFGARIKGVPPVFDLPNKPEGGINITLAASGNLLVNFGIWQGWMQVLKQPYVLGGPANLAG